MSPRTLKPGDPLTHFGMLVTAEGSEAPLRGLEVSAHGTAVTLGLLELARARARPFSARLASWEASGWEHTLARDGDRLRATLRSARVRPGGADRQVPARRARDALACAVWVALEGVALREGEGVLQLDVSTPGTSVHACWSIRVARDERPEVLTLACGWDAAPDACRARVERALDGIARCVAALPRGPRVMVASGAAPERIYLRKGCVVLGARGVKGDRRYHALRARLYAAGLERLALSPPGGPVAKDDALSIEIVRAARYRPGPTELFACVGRAWVPPADEAAFRAALQAACDADRVVLEARAWAPDLRAALRAHSEMAAPAKRSEPDDAEDLVREAPEG